VRRSRAALIVTVLYAICISALVIANQRSIDPEAVIVGQIFIGLLWDLLLIVLRVNGEFGPYLYAASLILNAATLYVVIAWATRRKKSRQPIIGAR
jgi:hypothetical protein